MLTDFCAPHIWRASKLMPNIPLRRVIGMIKSFEDFQTFGKDGMDAYVASATAMTKGFQTITAEAVEFSRKAFEKSSEAFEKAAAAKSFDKALEVQQGYAKDAYES